MAIWSLHQFSRFYSYVRLLGFQSDSFPHSNLSFSPPLQSLSNLEASLLNREASMRLWWRWCFIHDEYDEQVTVFSLMFFFLDVCLLMYTEWGRWDLREFPTSISLFLFYSSFSEKKSQYVRILLEMEIFSSFDEIFSLWLRNQFGKSQESVWKLENWKEFNIILFVTYFF